MKTLCPFVTKFSSIISWKLSCFDRVIFKGHLSTNRAEVLQKFVDRTLKTRRYDFIHTTAAAWSERLIDHPKDYAAKFGRTYEYHQRHPCLVKGRGIRAW
jgi:hypothetical protein